MSIARHHAEWLSLVPVSGPFLSLPVLMTAFGTGLEPHDPDHFRLLRQEYGNWQESFEKKKTDPIPHRHWIKFVLTKTLDLDEGLLVEGQAIPQTLQYSAEQYHELVRPNIVLLDAETKKPRLLVQTYPRSQELTSYVPNSPWKASPDTRMTELLHATGVRLGLITNGEHWMLVDAPKGETAGYASWYAALWLEEKITLQAFRSLLSSNRFFNVPVDKTLESLLKQSASNQQEVTDQLGFQVRRAVEVLIHSLDKADQDYGRALLGEVKVDVLYESALTIMMRLVFLFCAEERELIPSKPFPVYEQNYSVSTISKQLRELADQHGEELLERRYDAWPRLLAAFRAVYGGLRHDDVHIPAYGGNLFNPDRFPFLEGRKGGTSWRDTEANPLPVNNRTVLHLLEALQFLEVRVPGVQEKTLRRISFRHLDIEQIGHVYEGLLDHTAKRAAEPFLGLAGTREKEPELPLAELEKLMVKGEADLVDFLVERTGRSEAAIRSDLEAGLNSATLDLDSLPHGLVKYKSIISQIMGIERTRNSDSPKPLPEAIQSQVEEMEAALHECLKRGDPVSVVTARHILEILRKLRTTAPTEPKKRKIASSQKRLLDDQFFVRVRTVCQGDKSLHQRLIPFAGLIRLDNFGYPVVIPTGSVFVTSGTDRRSSGTHYTPKSLTEPIVKYTLRPLVNFGPAEGKPKNEWKLKSVSELLALKICDMACGSGAFLVQAARYMAERLLEAWDVVKKANPTSPGVTPDGEASSGKAEELLIPEDPVERMTFAMRIIAQRCLYGVDKNPLAVEMAKLSLWLLTLAKDKPFEFLDHSIRCGDSLVGLHSIDQLRHYSLKPDSDDPVLFKGPLDEAVDEAISLRLKLEDMQSNRVEDVERQEALLKDANEKIARLLCAADLLVAAEFWGEGAKDKLEKVRFAANRSAHHVDQGPTKEFEQVAAKERRGQLMFHWPLEFPEVIVHRGGFDAFVGNPPFMGGSKITGFLGTEYRSFVVDSLTQGEKGKADLSGYFLLRSIQLVCTSGLAGMLSTNSISQGDNRKVCLDLLVSQGNPIIRAYSSLQWPGNAGVTIAVLWVRRGHWHGGAVLDGIGVAGISSFLTPPDEASEQPHRLANNIGKSFRGTEIKGEGFILSPQDAETLAEHDPRNQDVIVPFLTGQDINSFPVPAASRYVINFQEWDIAKSEVYKECFRIVTDKVKPFRDTITKQIHEADYWKFWDKRLESYARLSTLGQVLVRSERGNMHSLAFVTNEGIFANTVIVIGLSTPDAFACLQSSLHEEWCRRFGGAALRTDMSYSPKSCFETFAFPIGVVSGNGGAVLERLKISGEEFYALRQSVMSKREEGLTTTYNRFHDSYHSDADIQKLRDLHIEMDQAVAAAYGWSDLELGHDFHKTKQGVRFTISEPARREVLQRLLKLNHERYAEEVKQGLHSKKKANRRAAPRQKLATEPEPEDANLFDQEDQE